MLLFVCGFVFYVSTRNPSELLQKGPRIDPRKFDLVLDEEGVLDQRPHPLPRTVY